MQRAIEDGEAKNELYEFIYNELRKAAHRLLTSRSNSEMQTTDLVNEVVLRIERAESLKKFANRRVFFSVATMAMKQVLTDQYRRQKRRIENGQIEREPLDTVIQQVEEETEFDFELLSQELDKLEQDSPRQHAVIMHRYFGGLSVADTAKLLDISTGTVERDWRLARAKLFVRLSDEE